MKRVYALLCLLGLAAAGPACAQETEPVDVPVTEARTPNFLGATGLLFAPSAYTQYDRSASAFFYGQSQLYGGGVLVGIANRLELGASVYDFSRSLGGGTNVLVNGKFNLLPESRSVPAFSVGVTDMLDQLDIDPSWYIMASKYLTRNQADTNFGLKLHLGFGGGLYDENIIAGAELLFNRNFGALAELVDGDINLGARYTAGGFSATFGLFDFDRIGGGLSYSLRF